MANITKDERLVMLERIAELIVQAKKLKQADLAFLLNMAHLDLQTNIHGINDDELQAFATAIWSSIERH